MILYLSSQQHTNLLDFLAEKEDALPIKKMTGNFMLKQFVIYDMRNFSHCTELVLDRIAFGDEDRDFAQAIEEFLTMYNARITVICEGLKESDPLCRALLDAGVGNIVTDVEIRGMQEEIMQSLSSQGMTRYEPKEQKKTERKGERYRWVLPRGLETQVQVWPMWRRMPAVSFLICQMPMRWMRKQEGIAWKKCGMEHRHPMQGFTFCLRTMEQADKKQMQISCFLSVVQSPMRLCIL